MIALEKDIENKLIKMVESHDGLCLKWVCPGWSGVPDRIIILPGAHVIFVETKRPRGGKLSKLQKWWINKLQSFGFYATPAWTIADIKIIEVIIVDILARNNT